MVEVAGADVSGVAKGGSSAAKLKAFKVIKHARFLKRQILSYKSSSHVGKKNGEVDGTIAAAIAAALADGRLPRDVTVSATIALPSSWSAGEPPALPTLLSFRTLLDEQYAQQIASSKSDAQKPCQPAQVQEAGGSVDIESKQAEAAKDTRPRASSKASVGVESTSALAQIGKRDILGDVVRSMENRLSRQGLLAAPRSILGRRKRQRKAADEEFYDADDDFIDDEELEEVNAYDDQRDGTNAPPASSGAGKAKEDSSNASVAAVGATETKGDQEVQSATRGWSSGPKLDLSAFRLTGPEVSGTSAEGESGADSSEVEAGECGEQLVSLSRDPRSWSERLALEALQDDVAWAVAIVPSDSADKISEADKPCGPPDNGLHDIQEALTNFCIALESAASAQQESTDFRQSVVSELRGLWTRLPGLLRPKGSASGSGRWQLRKYEAACGVAIDAKDAEIFGWSAAEEIAWACFLWSLVRSACANQHLQRSVFVRRWLEAIKEQQRATMGQAELKAVDLVRVSSSSAGTSSSAAAGVKGGETDDPDLAQEETPPHPLQPLSAAIFQLKACHLRNVFWNEQRQQSRLCVTNWIQRPVPINALAIYITAKVRGVAAQSVQVNDVMSFLGYDPANPDAGSSNKPKRILPMILPCAVYLQVGGVKIECTLHQVISPDKQVVTCERVMPGHTFKSLTEAARMIASRTFTKEQLQKIGDEFQSKLCGWALFWFATEKWRRSLGSILTNCKKYGTEAFQNPSGTPQIRCQYFKVDVSQIPGNTYQKEKQKKQLKQRLAVGNWVSCKDVNENCGYVGMWYNAKVVLVRHTEGGATTVNVEWVGPNKTLEKGVTISRLKEVYMFTLKEQVSVFYGGRWLSGTVEAVPPAGADPAEAKFEVAFGGRKLKLGLDLVRQFYPPPGSPAGVPKSSARAKGSRGRGGGGGGGRGRGVPPTAGDASAAVASATTNSAPTVTTGGAGRGGNSKAAAVASSSTSGSAPSKATPEPKGEPSAPRPAETNAEPPVKRATIEPGTHVRFIERHMWLRGMVVKDNGETVDIKTHKNTGASTAVTISKDSIHVLPAMNRTSFSSRPRAGEGAGDGGASGSKGGTPGPRPKERGPGGAYIAVEDSD